MGRLEHEGVVEMERLEHEGHATDREREWVRDMEASCLEHSTADNRDESPADGRIHKVPTSLSMKDGATQFYIPQVVSLGPYHFIGIEKKDDEMELLKTEIARNVHFALLQKEKEGEKGKEKEGNKTLEEKGQEKSCADVDENGLKSAIKRFKEKEEEIKKIYAESFEVSGEVLAWMMARDACFVRHVLERFRQDDVDESTESASIKRPLGGKRYHPLMTNIVNDVLKMENQLPFWALKEISPQEYEKRFVTKVYRIWQLRRQENDWLVSALKNLSPINVANVRFRTMYTTEYSHILQLLRDYIVDSEHENSVDSEHEISVVSDHENSVVSQQSFPSRCSHWSAYDILDWFSEICWEFDWDDLRRPLRPLVWLSYYFILTIILIVLSPVLFLMFIIFLRRDFVPPE